MARALAAGHEGVMAKDPRSPYEPGGRGKRWFEAEGRAERGLRDRRRRSRLRPPRGLAVELPPRGARRRRLGGGGQDFQRADRPRVHRDDRAAAGAGHRRRRLHGAGAPGGDGRGGVQRRSRRARPTVRLRAPLRPHRRVREDKAPGQATTSRSSAGSTSGSSPRRAAATRAGQPTWDSSTQKQRARGRRDRSCAGRAGG